MLDEELHLPGELLDVERNPVGQVLGRLELGAAVLNRGDQGDGLPVEVRVLRGSGRAEMGLERDVAEVLEREHADVVGMPEDLRDRNRHALEQPRDVGERQRVHVEGRRVQRQHERRAMRRLDAVVAPIGGVAGQRDDPRAEGAQAVAAEVDVDSFALLGRVRAPFLDSAHNKEPG